MIGHFFEIYIMKYLLILLIAVTNVAFAKEPTSKHCLQLGRQYRHAVRTHSPARHRLVERLWVECGK
jgi:hypothetical protein